MNLDYPGSDQLNTQGVTPPGSIPVSCPQSLIKVDKLAYLIWELPNLERQEGFLQEFGMLTQSKDEGRLYMRSYGGSPYIYIARKAKKVAFVGLGFIALNRQDLEVLARVHNTSIETLNRPGGGEVVRLQDPSGVQVEVCHGIVELEPIDTRKDVLPCNTPTQTNRINQGQRAPLAPSPILSIGHCVMGVNKMEETSQWYMRNLGLIPTDVQCLADASHAVMFMRLDRGEQLAEHHTVVLVQGVGKRYLHSAYQVVDLDALAQGQQYLKMKNRKHFWGIGRHLLGSQLFDYWLDPFGCEYEHYTDSDVFTADHPTGFHPLDPGNLYAWGDDLPAAMVGTTPRQILNLLRAVFGGELSLNWLKQAKKALSRKARPWL